MTMTITSLTYWVVINPEPLNPPLELRRSSQGNAAINHVFTATV